MALIHLRFSKLNHFNKVNIPSLVLWGRIHNTSGSIRQSVRLHYTVKACQDKQQLIGPMRELKENKVLLVKLLKMVSLLPGQVSQNIGSWLAFAAQFNTGQCHKFFQNQFSHCFYKQYHFNKVSIPLIVVRKSQAEKDFVNLIHNFFMFSII